MMRFDHYTIRLLEHSDLQEYYGLIDRNRIRLEDFFAGTVAITQNLEDTKRHVEDVVGKIAVRGYYPFVVTDDISSRLIASIQVKSIDWTIPKAELGYYIDAGYEGKGIITKAVAMIITYCFEELGFEKVYIRTYEGNVSSCKIAEKNGLIHEGTIRRDYKKTDGTVVDIMYFGIVREEYFNQKAISTGERPSHT